METPAPMTPAGPPQLDPDDEEWRAAADELMPSSDDLAEMVRLGPGPPPGWFDDEDWTGPFEETP